MKAPPTHALRLAAFLYGLGVMVATAPPTRAQSAADPAAPPSYEDRLIGGGSLTPDISLGDYSTPGDTSGLARSVRIDAVASVLDQQGQNAGPALHENGIVADAQWETVSYGAWSADAALRIGHDNLPLAGFGNSNAAFSVHERAMPFDDGWQADGGLGDLNTPLINLARLQPRFILASGTMLGVETEWRGPAGLQIVAGGGEPGIYDGIKVPTFQTLGGSTATVGAQWAPAPQWTVGAEYAAAHDANIYYQPLNSTLLPTDVSNQRISSNTGLLSAAWQTDGDRAQLNVIDGTLDGKRNALGFWADASHTHGSLTQSYGAFRIDPNLAWGNQLIASDVQGGYYRLGYQSRRWIADFGIDEVKSVSGNGASTFVNGNTRYQLSRDSGVGGAANVLLSGDGTHRIAWSVEGFLDRANSFGTGRAQLDYATDPQVRDSRVTLQQNWEVRSGARLATSVAVDRIRSEAVLGLPAADSTIVRLAAYGGGDLTARLSLNGSVQWAQAVQGRAAPSTSADVSLNWQMARCWELLGTYYENRLGAWTPLVVSSPLAPPTPAPQGSAGQRGFFLTVRYQQARGGHFVPLGGMAGTGSGRLSGVVYLDTNENGRFDAGESGAANVTVILDGRFSTRTDSNGRYDFPAVAAGRHVLTVQADNLPLPWTLTNSGRTEVTVATRDRTEVDIGALRLK